MWQIKLPGGCFLKHLTSFVLKTRLKRVVEITIHIVMAKRKGLEIFPKHREINVK